ncbi:hypothetical protein TorRG33x02_016090 [Trema orientale]|uniref:Uncharacterized protein n=1 Tax=Trema orientale TaxID=63057 RepID=A0A2P5FXU8_TREOI|nr:hypothetical protein TorRG33x02_016090 [Trema orientale]
MEDSNTTTCGSMGTGKLSSPTTTNTSSSLKYYDREKYYASRQIFLRSYKFTKKKENLGTRTKKWLKTIKPKTVIKSQFDGGSGSSAKGRSFWFILMSCKTKFDVHD